ncbi:MAG: glutamate-5-semialdehyde dehydrogenase [Saprospiraceae bacterium]|nr:glutamate-5-semialdehyde dehydrogenase [Saprospiraceae bacterium]
MVLSCLSSEIAANVDEILEANKLDMAACDHSDPALYDRLKVDEKKIKQMIKAIDEAINAADPVGLSLYVHHHENGLICENKSVPFGRILIIYESRPDVTIEAAIIAFKAGNKILLKGGKEARNTNLVLTSLWHNALTSANVPLSYIQYLDLDREATQKLISDTSQKIDLIIPRGGEGLINFVRSNSQIPMIISGRGNNFMYIDNESDFEMAISIAVNGKSRISVCNALDKVLINKNILDIDHKIKSLYLALQNENIHVLRFGNIGINDVHMEECTDTSIWYEEFLAPKLLISLVDDMDQAIEMINTFSGGHSATIISANEINAMRFQSEVDCGAVYHNASIRFTDGGQFGFSAEIAISTQKLHFRGPVGIDQLVCNKWFIKGTGQIR